MMQIKKEKILGSIARVWVILSLIIFCFGIFAPHQTLAYSISAGISGTKCNVRVQCDFNGSDNAPICTDSLCGYTVTYGGTTLPFDGGLNDLDGSGCDDETMSASVPFPGVAGNGTGACTFSIKEPGGLFCSSDDFSADNAFASNDGLAAACCSNSDCTNSYGCDTSVNTCTKDITPPSITNNWRYGADATKDATIGVYASETQSDIRSIEVWVDGVRVKICSSGTYRSLYYPYGLTNDPRVGTCWYDGIFSPASTHTFYGKAISSGGTKQSSSDTFTLGGGGCSGNVALSFNPTSGPAGTNITATISGLSGCSAKTATISTSVDSIVPSDPECEITSGSSCSLIFDAPSATRTYYALIDKNGDSDRSDSGEASSGATFTVPPPGVCAGDIALSLNPSSGFPGTSITATASGLSGCNGKLIKFGTSATPALSTASVANCTVFGSGCSASFNGPSSTTTYYSWVDKNTDGAYNWSNGTEISIGREFTIAAGCHLANGSAGSVDSHCTEVPANKYHDNDGDFCWATAECTCNGDDVMVDGECRDVATDFSLNNTMIVEDGVPGDPSKMGTGSLASFKADARSNSGFVKFIDVYINNTHLAELRPYKVGDSDEPGRIRNWNYYTRVRTEVNISREQDDDVNFTTDPQSFLAGSYTYWSSAEHTDLDDIESSTRTFTVLPSPDVIFDTKPSDPAIDSTAIFTYHCTDEPCEYKYRLDYGVWSAWQPYQPLTFTGLGPGSHFFEINARNISIKAKGPAATWGWHVPLPVGSRNIFTTSSRYEGDLSAVSESSLHLSSSTASANIAHQPYEADIICQDHANDAGLNWAYRALISKANYRQDDSTTHDRLFEAKDRLDTCGQIYNMQGQSVATSCSDLWDNSIANGIKFNEFGVPVSYGVWTGTYASGLGSVSYDKADTKYTCENWTSDDGEFIKGKIGDPNAIDSKWVDNGNQECGIEDEDGDIHPENLRGLYCYRDTFDSVKTVITKAPPSTSSDLTATFEVACESEHSSIDHPCKFEYRVYRQRNSSNWSDYDLLTTATQTVAGEKTTINLAGYTRNGHLNPFKREGYVFEVRAITNEPQEELQFNRYSWDIGLPTGGQYIFATSADKNGNLGGITGADAICQSAANGNFTGTFKALISDSTLNAKARIASCNLWNTNMNGSEQVSVDCSDLWDGSILESIIYDESGASRSDDVWTGSFALGMAAPQNCSNWTSSSSSRKGEVGDNGSTDADWVETGESSCNQLRPIYCFQQSGAPLSPPPGPIIEVRPK